VEPNLNVSATAPKCTAVDVDTICHVAWSGPGCGRAGLLDKGLHEIFHRTGTFKVASRAFDIMIHEPSRCIAHHRVARRVRQVSARPPRNLPSAGYITSVHIHQYIYISTYTSVHISWLTFGGANNSASSFSVSSSHADPPIPRTLYTSPRSQ
jgi:hypothetical protein